MSKKAERYWENIHKVAHNTPINHSNVDLATGITGSMLDLGAKTVLEVGCGRICRANHPSIYYVGVDFCLTPIKELHEREGVECVRADARHLPFRDKVFDCVMSVAAIQHVGEEQPTQNTERMKAQREMVRVSNKYIFAVSENHSKDLVEIAKPEFQPMAAEERLSRVTLVRQPPKLHLGSGSKHFDDYINVDVSKNPAVDVLMDASTLPFRDGSVEEIVAYDVIEHLSREKFESGIKEWHRALKHGGSLIIESPDIEVLCRDFLNASEEERWERWQGMKGIVWQFYGLQLGGNPKEKWAQTHKWGYTAKRLIAMLSFGFKDFKTPQARASHHHFRVECVKR